MKHNLKSYKVYLESAQLGCKPNAITISQIARYLRENQHEITMILEEADFIIYNTCGAFQVTENMSQKFVREAVKNKKDNAQILAIGCLNKINPLWLEGQLKDIQLVENVEALDRFFSTLKKIDTVHQACLDVSDYNFTKILDSSTWFVKVSMFCGEFVYEHFKDCSYPRFARARFGRMLDEVRYHNKFFVQIGSGCVGNCSYCIIKKAKGAPKSRPIENIIQDLQRNYSKGKVINLVADDCPSFGVDTGTNLFELLDEINKFFPNAPIDLSYINPLWLEQYEQEFIDMFKRININSVNISMQSFSDKVISLMNRKYQSQNIIGIIKKIRKISPDTLIWGHMIAGFPGESWSDFYESMKQCKCFDYFYAFAYSPRPGTASFEMDNTNSSFWREIRRQLLQYMQLVRIVKRVFL